MNWSQGNRMDRLVKEKRHDTYKQYRKMPEPTVCANCGAIFTNGRWSWGEATSKAHEVICPVCQRATDGYPAGFLEIKGIFFGQHRKEILNLIRNEEKLEKTQRPMERIIKIAKGDNCTKVTTTGVHVAQRIGKALAHAYQGDLTIKYGDGESSVRVYWAR